MDSGRYIVLLLILTFVTNSVSRRQPFIKLISETHHSNIVDDGDDNDLLYCNSFRFSVETNDAGSWTIPTRCLAYVQDYMTGEQYQWDLEVVADRSFEYLNSLNLTGKDAWVFDIDETLLSTVPYYVQYGFASDDFNETAYNEWVLLGEAPVLRPSFRFYRAVKEANITIFLLTGRDEDQRNATVKNLIDAGYSSWEKLILRGTLDEGTKAIVFKSEKRREIEEEGYTIHGCSGDQWSDLLGHSKAKRLFKLPDPMYYLS